MTNTSTPSSLYAYGFVIVGAVTLMGVSLGTPHWIELTAFGPTVNFGLFEVCVNDDCSAYKTTNSMNSLDGLDTVKGLVITAVILYGLSIFVIAHLVLIQHNVIQTRNHGNLTVSMCIFGAILAWAGVGYFVLKTRSDLGDRPGFSDVWHYGYSLYLAAASGFISLVAGFVANSGVGTLFTAQHSRNINVVAPTPHYYPNPAVSIVDGNAMNHPPQYP